MTTPPLIIDMLLYNVPLGGTHHTGVLLRGLGVSIEVQRQDFGYKVLAGPAGLLGTGNIIVPG